MRTLIASAETVFGRAITRVMLLSVAAAVPAVVVAFLTGNAAVFLASVAANFLFFGGLAAGGVAISAMVMTVHGGWARAMLPAAEACGSFFLPAFILLGIAMGGAYVWTPWGPRVGTTHAAIVVVRDLVFAAVLYGAGWRFLVRARAGKRTPQRAAIYLLCYAILLSILTYDVAMSLYDGEPSTIEPPLYFMAALLGGLAWSTVIGSFERVATIDDEGRHDAGKLLFSLSTFWAYLVWSAFLPTWYANIPEESELLLRRVDGWYRPLTIFALLAAVIVPATMLLSAAGKRNRYVLRAAGLLVLAGLHAVCYLFVFPDLPFPATLAGWGVALGVTLATGGVFVLGYAGSLVRHERRHEPATQPEALPRLRL